MYAKALSTGLTHGTWQIKCHGSCRHPQRSLQEVVVLGAAREEALESVVSTGTALLLMGFSERDRVAVSHAL